MLKLLFLGGILVGCLTAFAQKAQIIPRVEVRGYHTNDKNIPFWLRSNQFGSVPISGSSLSLIPGIEKKYHKPYRAILDWGLGAEVRANTGNTTHVELIEGYVKGRLTIFELKAGRSKDVTGLFDTTLSTGSFSVSGNALGIPKVQLSIPEYYTLPVFWRVFSVKGKFSYGWVGDVYVHPRPYPIYTFYHEKSIYGKFGKPNWRINILGGFNHQAFWGNEKEFNTINYNLSEWETYQSVVFGRTFGWKDIPRSKIGNHLGSIDYGLEVRLNKFRIFCYRQNFYDTGALYYLENIEDGLQGISITNLNFPKNAKVKVNKMLFEVFYSKNQAAEDYSGPTSSGDEDYYNNYIYKYGWSYNQQNLGNPFITSRNYTRKTFKDNSITKYYVNNRVIAFHTGSEGRFFGINYLYKVSYSLNYGTYTVGYTPSQRFRIKRATEVVEQLSLYLELDKELKKNFRIGIGGAIDYGKLLEEGSGVFIKCSKSFSR